MISKYWLITTTIIFSCLIGATASAEVVSTSIFDLDKPTLVRGFTVSSADQLFNVTIAPKQFASRVMVKVLGVTETEVLPQSKVAISPIYLLDIKTGLKGVLKKAVPVSFSITDLSQAKNPKIYYYDGVKKSWISLASNVNCATGIISAKTIFPYVKFVVLGDNIVSPFGQLFNEDILTAHSALVVDTTSGGIFFEKNVDEVRSIASLIKLAVAITFLDHNPGWGKLVTVQKDDFVGGATLYAKVGDKITVKDFFYAMLIGSKNNATRALMRSTGYTESQFIELMNEKALSLGLTKTHFVEPTGLDPRNVSTATEYLKIAEKAFNNPVVFAATTTKAYRIHPVNSKLSYLVENTSKKVLNRDLTVTGTKTGWTDEAGYCLVTQAKSGSKQIIALVLGAKITKNYEEVYNLLKKYL